MLCGFTAVLRVTILTGPPYVVFTNISIRAYSFWHRFLHAGFGLRFRLGLRFGLDLRFGLGLRHDVYTCTIFLNHYTPCSGSGCCPGCKTSRRIRPQHILLQRLSLAPAKQTFSTSTRAAPETVTSEPISVGVHDAISLSQCHSKKTFVAVCLCDK